MDENPAIKAAFFDLGKVLLNFNHDNIVERVLSRAAGREEKRAPLHGYLFDAREGLCNRYDEGGITSREFFAAIDSRFGLGVGFEEFAGLWNDIFTEDAETAALMREVRGRVPVYLLSNVNELHWEYIRGRFWTLSEMDGWVLSYKVRAKKPARAIYEAALALSGTRPEETLFIDDLPENTEGARSLGIRAITFAGAEALRAELADGYGLVRL